MTTVDSSAVEALGWALVHFTWQGALAGVVFAVFDLALRGASPRVRYGLAASTLAVMALLPPVTMLAGRAAVEHAAAIAAAPRSGEAAGVTLSPVTPAVVPEPVASVRARIAGALPEVVGLWCAGVLIFSVRYLGGWRLVRRLDRSARPLDGTDTAARLERLARRMRITRPVRLLESAVVEVPTVVGWLRPAILLPVATLAGLTAEQLEAVLAHELAHIRRQDYLAGLLQSAVETVLFYHPAVWWVSHRMRVERELCCDDEAVAACGDPIRYARALADLEAARPAPMLAQAATGGPLFVRIARLVRPGGHAGRASRGAAALLALSAIAVAVTGATSLRASAQAGQAATEATEEKRRAPAARPLPREAATPKARPAAAASAAPVREAAPERDTRPVPIERVLELAGAGVTPEYIDEMAALGHGGLSWDQLIAMRSHGVTTDFVRGMAEVGHAGLRAEQLIALRSRGVSPGYVRELAAEGLKDLSMSDLIELRSQGVGPDYVKELRAAGYGGLSVTDLVGARSQGVSPEDAAELKALGYEGLGLGRLISLRSQGVSAEYVRELQAEGYKGLSVPVLIGLRSQGVTVEYVRELKKLGYAGLPAGELIALRAQGVTPEFVREIKDAGYDKVTPRELIELRSRGVDPELLRRLKAHKEGGR